MSMPPRVKTPTLYTAPPRRDATVLEIVPPARPNLVGPPDLCTLRTPPPVPSQLALPVQVSWLPVPAAVFDVIELLVRSISPRLNTPPPALAEFPVMLRKVLLMIPFVNGP